MAGPSRGEIPDWEPDRKWMDETCETARKMIIEAEHMKVKLEAPQGVGLINYSDQVDDKFFHITYHVDFALRTKIEQKHFVELEKLLIKDRPFMKAGTDNSMGLCTKDGVTYFAPMFERETKITNIRKWEQAFRVYVVIYSKAKPGRASEIWQDMH